MLSSKLPTARKFRRGVTSEVLPSIRRTGGYNLPKDYPSALRALADTEEKRLALLAENEAQRQVIADFEPVRQYVDTILHSKGSLATSQIAADYGISARALNRILHEDGIQHKVNSQWILYPRTHGQGLDRQPNHPVHPLGQPPGRQDDDLLDAKGPNDDPRPAGPAGDRAVMDREGA